MLRPILAVCGAGLISVSATSHLALAQATDASPADLAATFENLTAEQFVAAAASSNMFEIASSQTALEQGAEGEAAAFAQRMIEDHDAAGAKMMEAAQQDRVTVAEALTPEHQAKLDELAAMQGEEYVTAYLEAQVAAHEEAVALFTAYSETGEEGALRDFAAGTLTALEEHLAEVRVAIAF